MFLRTFTLHVIQGTILVNPEAQSLVIIEEEHTNQLTQLLLKLIELTVGRLNQL